jgi:hypothetical protein
MTTAFIAPWIRRAIALAGLGRARAALAATAFGLARHGTAWDVLPSAPSAYSVYLYWRRGVGTSTHCGRLSAELSLQPANLGACLLHSCVAGAPGRVLSRRRHCPASVSSEHECARQLAIAKAAASLAPTHASTAQAISPDRSPFPTTATKSGTVPAPRWSARQRPPRRRLPLPTSLALGQVHAATTVTYETRPTTRRNQDDDDGLVIPVYAWAQPRHQRRDRVSTIARRNLQSRALPGLPDALLPCSNSAGACERYAGALGATRRPSDEGASSRLEPRPLVDGECDRPRCGVVRWTAMPLTAVG